MYPMEPISGPIWMHLHHLKRFDVELLAADRGLIHQAPFGLSEDSHAATVVRVSRSTGLHCNRRNLRAQFVVAPLEFAKYRFILEEDELAVDLPTPLKAE